MVTIRKTWNIKAVVRLLIFVVACCSTLPVVPYVLSGAFLWTDPYVMLQAVLASKTFVWPNLIAVAVWLTAVFYKRFFCRILCPIGFLFDATACVTKKKSCLFTQKMPKLNRWLAIAALFAAVVGYPVFAFLDPTVSFHAFSASLHPFTGVIRVLTASLLPLLLLIQLLAPGLWCSKICPCGGLQEIAYDLRSNQRNNRKCKQKVSMQPEWMHSESITSGFGKSVSKRSNVDRCVVSKRRSLIFGGLGILFSAGTGVLSGLFLPKLWASKPVKRLKPPSAVDDSHFPFLCVRCGSCVHACPSHIIQSYRQTNDLRLWFTPTIDFSSGYCIDDCTHCGTVCPSGALQPFSKDKKKELVIGKATLDIRSCLLQQQQECDRCVASCSYDAIHITHAGSLFDTFPVISSDVCVGCGACAAICPEQCFTIDVTVHHKIGGFC